MNLIPRLTWFQPVVAPVVAPRLPQRCAATQDDSATAGRGGCGWFDSSHELQLGLLVQEHASPDTLGTELPLGPWLALHLAAWQPVVAPQ